MRRFGGAVAGSAAVEFSFIAPVLIVMGAGVWELTRAFEARSAVNKLASQYAVAYADCVDLPAGTCNTELSTYGSAFTLKNLEPLLLSSVGLQMFQVTNNNGVIQATYNYPSNAVLTSAQQTAAAAVMPTSGQSGVVVTASYTYTLTVFPFTLNGIVPASMPMSYTVAQLKS